MLRTCIRKKIWSTMEKTKVARNCLKWRENWSRIIFEIFPYFWNYFWNCSLFSENPSEIYNSIREGFKNKNKWMDLSNLKKEKCQKFLKKVLINFLAISGNFEQLWFFQFFDQIFFWCKSSDSLKHLWQSSRRSSGNNLQLVVAVSSRPMRSLDLSFQNALDQ